MCFYDQYHFACGDLKWGHFREHCSKCYQPGGTCGIKLVMSTIPKREKCKVCIKIDTKKGRIQKAQDRIRRSEHEQKRGHHRGASIESSQQQIAQLEWEIQGLEYQKADSRNTREEDQSPTASSVLTSITAQVPSYETSHSSSRYTRRNLYEEIGVASASAVGETVTPDSSSKKNAKSKFSDTVTPSERSLPQISAARNNSTENRSRATNDGDLIDTTSSIVPVPTPPDAPSERSSTEPTGPELRYEKAVDVIWKCGCGCVFEETVVEFAPGAANRLAAATASGPDVDIEHLAASPSLPDAVSSSSSPSSEGDTPSMERVNRQRQSFRTKDRGGHTNTQETVEHPRREFVLLCRPAGKETILKHANVTKAPCDRSTYTVLHRKHFGRYHRVLKWVYLTEISSVDFAKFHIFWKKNVSIDIKDLGDLPQQPSEEYCYQADTNPPVLKTALRHFIQHPDHAPTIPYHRSRIPKKQRNKLNLRKDLGPQEGYGLYIQESICWTKLFVIEAILATCCVLFAIVWCVMNKGGIQDGFAIAGTGIAYLTIILGGLQAVGKRK